MTGDRTAHPDPATHGTGPPGTPDTSDGTPDTSDGTPGDEAGTTPDPHVALLPHRPPFLFVDRVIEMVGGTRITATYAVTGEESFLAGHFPGRPVFPGVLQLEALAQTGAIAVLADDARAGQLPLFGGVEEVRFRRQVVPGDELHLAMELEKLSSRGGWGRGTATVDGRTTCSGRLFFVLAPA